MDVESLFVSLFLLGVWLAIGMTCIKLWEDAFDDIETRLIRVSARILMLFLWPAWLCLWAVCVGLGILFIIGRELLK